jgi:hypothetical protein
MFRTSGRDTTATADVLAGPLFASVHRTHLREAVAASTVGTTIE